MSENEKKCPKCRTAWLKTWDKLSANEKFVAERLPGSAEFPRAEREKHLFCPRCWFETKPFAEKV